METYVPVPTALAASILTTQDGDPPTSATLGGPQKVLANALRDLQNKVDPASLGLNPVSTRMLGTPMAGTNCTLSAQGEAAGEFPMPCVLTSGPGTVSLAYLLDLPHGAKMQQIRVYFYEDTQTLSAITVSVIRRDYANVAVAPGDPADHGTETVLGTGTVKVSIAGGMRRCDAGFASHTINREDACDYSVRIVATATAGSGVRFMPKVRAYILATTTDLGAA